MKKTITLIVLALAFTFNYAQTITNSMLHADDKNLAMASANEWAGQQHNTTHFIENKGQIIQTDGNAAPYVQFALERGNTSIYLLKNGVAWQFNRTNYPEGYNKLKASKHTKHEDLERLQKLEKEIHTETYRMDMTLVGANTNAKITTEGKSDDYINYYSHDALDVHHYKKITYHEIYPGIDWVIYTTAQGMKYDFVIHPGANPSLIQMRLTHQEELYVDAEGKLLQGNRMGKFIEDAPVSYQNGVEVSTRFALKANILSFILGKYDPAQTLVIDPARIWATYYGGSSSEVGNSCAVDAAGNIYLAGGTSSSSGIASGGHQNTYGGGGDAFLVKFNSSGTRLWATYYGGATYNDYANGLCTDASNNVYLSGSASSTSNIASGGHQNTLSGTVDAFLVKFNSSGVRQWATYYGGAEQEYGTDCVVDASSNVYLCGETYSSSGIASGGHDLTYGANSASDAFLVKFNSSGTRQWATYYGGTDWEDRPTCAIDGSGNVYLAGSTWSTASIAMAGGHQTTLGGQNDAFLVKFNTSGVRQWATYYGNTGGESDISCATDGTTAVYLAGSTGSSTSIASGGHQNSIAGSWDGFVAKFNTSGVRQWGTYYGGTGSEFSSYGLSGCVVDGSGNVYFSYGTESTSGIASGGHQMTFGGGDYDGFLVKLNSSGVRQWATYYGGSGDDFGNDCAVDGSGNVYLAGGTGSATSIASGGFSNSLTGGSDAFLAKFNSTAPTIATGTITGGPFCVGASVTIPYTLTGIVSSGNEFIAQLSSSGGSFSSPRDIGSVTSTGSGNISGTIPAVSGNGYRIRVVSSSPSIAGTDNGVNISINIAPTAGISPAIVSICSGQTATLTASGGSAYSWSTGATTAAIDVNSAATYTVTVTNGSGCTASASRSVTITAPTSWYLDADNDGWYIDSWTSCISPGPGYNQTATNYGDCDDDDVNVWQNMEGYVDSDGDGYATSSLPESVCSGATLPVGYIANYIGDDCDDNDISVFIEGPLYIDNDNDGYDDGLVFVCYGPPIIPAGYQISTIGSDCNDNDPAITFCDDHSMCTIGDYCLNGVCQSGSPLDCDDGLACNGEEICHPFAGCLTPALCDLDGDGYTEDVDCDDLNPDIHPGATDICDGEDNDCDFDIDEDEPQQEYFEDYDGDGFGDASTGIFSCEPVAGYVLDGTDCDDTDENIYPGADEICNELDDNCNSEVDEDVLTTFYYDFDEDGYGDPAETIEACSPPLGYVADGTDCDDLNANLHPDQNDLCDELDNDCDGTYDEDQPAQLFYEDVDGDGFGDAASPYETCSQPAGYADNDADCDDFDAAISPAATEDPCNGIDDNCDGTIDEDRVDGCTDNTACNYDVLATCDDGSCTYPFTLYLDSDGDGYGDNSEPLTACTHSTDYVADNTDCDDANADVNPGASEDLCNNIDDNCDGTVDEGRVDGCRDNTACNYEASATCDDGSCTYAFTLYLDNDGDGFGDDNEPLTDCTHPANYVADNTDCDDDNEDVNPRASESLCNNVDDNCDGTIDEGRADGCTDNNACNYDALATCDDGSCTYPFTLYLDDDGDGFGDDNEPLTDCTHPADYVANNTDCDDAVATIYPGAVETCNGLDDDCDGFTDEGLSVRVYYRDLDGDLFGDAFSMLTACSQPNGYVTNKKDCNDTNPAIKPGAPEVCNGLDDNCNGTIDEIVGIKYFRDADGDGYGDNAVFVYACSQPVGYVANKKDCNDANPNIKPGASEICNGIDDDCDFYIDEGITRTYFLDADGDGFGNINTKTLSCAPIAGYVLNSKDCNDANPAIKPGAMELCNGIDDDCDNLIDENTKPGVPQLISGPTQVCRNATAIGYSTPPNALATNYIWTVSGGTIASGQGTNQIMVNWGNFSSGYVRVQLANSCYMGGTRTLRVNGISCGAKQSGEPAEEQLETVLSNEEEIAELDFYPNPVADLLTVRFQSSKERKGTLTVFDLMGKELFATPVSWAAGMNSYEISASAFSSGIYILVYRDEKLLQARRLVVQR